MATIETSPTIDGISGKVGDTIVSNRRGQVYLKTYVSPKNTITSSRQKARAGFARTISLWQSLPYFLKQEWNKYAEPFQKTGYNFFISTNYAILKTIDIPIIYPKLQKNIFSDYLIQYTGILKQFEVSSMNLPLSEGQNLHIFVLKKPITSDHTVSQYQYLIQSIDSAPFVAFVPEENTVYQFMSVLYNNEQDTFGALKTFEIYFPEVAMKYAHVKHTVPNNTASGTFTAGSYQTRPLNSINSNISGASLSINQIVLPAGTYSIRIFASVFDVEKHKLRLYNATDSTVELLGISTYSSNTYNAGNAAYLSGTFSISDTKKFEVQHRCIVTRAGNGFGVASNFSDDETYLDCMIEKIE